MVPSTISIAGPGAPAHGQIADERPHPEGDADGLIRIVTHGFVGSFRAFDRFVADTARDFLGAFQRGGETSAGVRDFFAGAVGGSCHQGARIFGGGAHWPGQNSTITRKRAKRRGKLNPRRPARRKEPPMPQGDKSSYTDKQKRQAEHIEAGYEKKGLSMKTAEARAWATVNKLSGGGKKSGSGRKKN